MAMKAHGGTARAGGTGISTARPVAEHRGDVLLIEPRVAIGHILDRLLRVRGVHVYPVASLDAAAAAGAVFAFGVVVVAPSAVPEGDDTASLRLRAAPGLREACILTPRALLRPSAGGAPHEAGESLDPHELSRLVLDALVQARARPGTAPSPADS